VSEEVLLDAGEDVEASGGAVDVVLIVKRGGCCLWGLEQQGWLSGDEGHFKDLHDVTKLCPPIPFSSRTTRSVDTRPQRSQIAKGMHGQGTPLHKEAAC
jgi:hypothetical protein